VDCTGFKELAEIIDIFPDDIQEIYNLALDFSRYVYALRTVYNVIVSDGENKEANERLEQCIQDFENIANIDIDYIMKKLEITNMMLKRFLDETKKCWYEKDIQQLKQCICNREEYLKDKSRARTAHPGEFDKNSWFGGRELSYRFYNARTIVRDIMESEGKINA
jgi:hypothetical protein